MGKYLRSSSGKAGASLVLGMAGITAWMIPWLGLLVAVTGFTLGCMSFESSNRDPVTNGIAITGMGLAVIVFFLSLVPGVILAEISRM